MGHDDNRRPPRPEPATTELQRQFFREWNEDRANGITPRSLHKMLSDHLDEYSDFKGETLGRLAGLEKSEERDSEERLSGTGRHHIPPPPPVPKMPSFRPWWGQEPWKTVIRYTLVALISLGLGALGTKLGMQPSAPAPVLTTPAEHAH